MSESTTKAVSIPSHLALIYGNHYDISILDSLVHNFGEEDATKLLQTCAKRRKDIPKLSDTTPTLLAEPCYTLLYRNLLDLHLQARELMKHHGKKLFAFLDDVDRQELKYFNLDAKLDTFKNVVKEKGDVIPFQDWMKTRVVSYNSFAACFFLAAVDKMGHRTEMIMAINHLAAKGQMTDYSDDETIYLIPPEGRVLHTFNVKLQSMIKSVVGEGKVAELIHAFNSIYYKLFPPSEAS